MQLFTTGNPTYGIAAVTIVRGSNIDITSTIRTASVTSRSIDCAGIVFGLNRCGIHTIHHWQIVRGVRQATAHDPVGRTHADRFTTVACESRTLAGKFALRGRPGGPCNGAQFIVNRIRRHHNLVYSDRHRRVSGYRTIIIGYRKHKAVTARVSRVRHISRDGTR